MALSLPVFARCTLTLDLPVALAADIHAYWLRQVAGSPGVLAAALADTDATLTITAPDSTVNFLTAGAKLAVGQTILIDEEFMIIAAIDGDAVTVGRSTTAFPSVLAPAVGAHAAGASVYLLAYSDPYVMIADRALRPWTQEIVKLLGNESATFGAKTSGSLEIIAPA
jgi:hypothetical protein